MAKQVRMVDDETGALPLAPRKWSALARSWAAPWAGVGLYALLFLAAGLIGYLPSNRPHCFAIVWFANGVLISGLIAARKRSLRIGIIVVSLVLAIGNSLVHGRPAWMAVLFALSNTAESVAGATLVLRASRGSPTVASVRGATLVVGLPILVSAALASAVSVLLLALGRRCLRLGADFFFVTFLEFERIRDALLAPSQPART
jgi:integral membrane sensor domain MASE1